MESLILSHVTDIRDTQAVEIYHNAIEQLTQRDLQPHEFVNHMMAEIEATITEQGVNTNRARALHGRFFEFVIGETLAQSGVTHMYYQAEVLHVPLTRFDWFLYHPDRPVSISCKTKARDRWKQAAHEARALKQIYPEAINYLVTIERIAQTDEKKKLAPLSIDHFVQADTETYTQEVKEIARMDYMEAIDQSPIRQGKLVVTR